MELFAKSKAFQRSLKVELLELSVATSFFSMPVSFENNDVATLSSNNSPSPLTRMLFCNQITCFDILPFYHFVILESSVLISNTILKSCTSVTQGFFLIPQKRRANTKRNSTLMHCLRLLCSSKMLFQAVLQLYSVTIRYPAAITIEYREAVK